MRKVCLMCGCFTLAVRVEGPVKVEQSRHWLTPGTAYYPSRQTCACGWQSNEIEYREMWDTDRQFSLLHWMEANTENLRKVLASMASFNRPNLTQKAEELNDTWPTGIPLPEGDEKGLEIDYLNGYLDS